MTVGPSVFPRRGKDGTRYLHHLALLGETPPKIPGLKEAETVSYEYADGDEVETYSFGGAITERKEDTCVDPKKELEELKKKHAELEAERKKLLEENRKLLEEKEWKNNGIKWDKRSNSK